MHGTLLPKIWPKQPELSRAVLRTLIRAVLRAATTARTTRDLTSSNQKTDNMENGRRHTDLRPFLYYSAILSVSQSRTVYRKLAVPDFHSVNEHHSLVSRSFGTAVIDAVHGLAVT